MMKDGAGKIQTILCGEAKVYMLCMCYALQELKDKREALLAGKRPRVPSRLLDTAALDEIGEAIGAYDCERFQKEREVLPEKHPILVPDHLDTDDDPRKALERGIRGLCVRESREYLTKLLDGIQPGPAEGYPWRMTGDATKEELGLAVALYDDELYRHLRDLAEKLELECLSMCNKWELSDRKEGLLAGKESRRAGSGLYYMVSWERLDKALERYGERRYAFPRKWMTREFIKFENGVYFYFITERSDVGTLIAGLVEPSVMFPLLGMVCLEDPDPRRVASFFVKNFHFNVVARNEPVENVISMQYSLPGLTDLIGDLEHGGTSEFLRVDVPDIIDRFTDKDMAAMVRSIDWKKCSKRLFSSNG